MYIIIKVDDQLQLTCMQSVVGIRMTVGESTPHRKNVLSDKQIHFYLYIYIYVCFL